MQISAFQRVTWSLWRAKSPSQGSGQPPVCWARRMPVHFLSTRLLPLALDTVAAGVTQLRIQHFVNVYFVDAGIPGSEKTIRAAAEELYGPEVGPQAIVLTHGRLGSTAWARHWHWPPAGTTGASTPPGAALRDCPGPVPAACPYRGRRAGVHEPLLSDPAARPARRGAGVAAGR